MKKKVSLSSEKFIEILTKNGEKPNALNDFFQILEDWGDSRNKITFYIMQSNTLDMLMESFEEEKVLSINYTVNLAIHDVMSDVYGDDEAYENFAHKYNGKRVCITKKRKNKKVDYRAEFEDLCAGMSVQEVAEKYGKLAAAIRQDKSRYLQSINSIECDKNFNFSTDS